MSLDTNTLSPGLYRIWWSSGGSSLAAVGMTHDGGRWIAPTNWQKPAAMTDHSSWSDVVKAEPIEPPPAGVSSSFWRDHIKTARDLLDTILEANDDD